MSDRSSDLWLVPLPSAALSKPLAPCRRFEPTMEVELLAAESLGVRSFATKVTFDDAELLIDPGTGLKQRTPEFLPHPVEYEALQSAASRIDEAAVTADAVVVTHYHHDHYVPLEEDYRWKWSTPKRSREVFANARVFAKNLSQNINDHQADRGRELRHVFDGVAADLEWGDGHEPVTLGGLTIRFSPAVPHGRGGGDYGWVFMVAVEGPNETIVYTSDVQGPIEADTTAWILAQEPDLVLVDGPPLYLPSHEFTPSDCAAARNNLLRLAEVADLVIDHHSCRAWGKSDFFEPIEAAAVDTGHTVDSVASYRGEPRLWLEAFQREINVHNPVDPSFYERLQAGGFLDEPIDWRDWML